MEHWKPVRGFDGYYSVSDLGRVRRDAPGGNMTHVGKILKPGIGGGCGYRFVILTKPRSGGIRKNVRVARLVAETFIGPPGHMTVNHKNGNKGDNRVANLEYMTAADNTRHGRSVLGRCVGEAHGRAKLTAAIVQSARKDAKSGTPVRQLAKKHGVAAPVMGRAIRGETWGSV